LNVYGSNYTDGDKFDGLTRKVGFDHMIPLYEYFYGRLSILAEVCVAYRMFNTKVK